MAKQVLILGAGYGGMLSALTLVNNLDGQDVEISLVNKSGTHQIITELHRLAAGSVSEKAVALPLERLLRGRNVNLRIGTVSEILLGDKVVALADGTKLKYDYLVIGLGSETAFFGIPGLKEHSFVLKSVDDANRLRAHVEECIARFSETHHVADGTFVVGGGGLTGIELVGELADALPPLCEKYGVNPDDISLNCIEAMPTILPGFPEELVSRAQTSLEKRRVRFLTNLPITQMDANVVHLKDGSSLETNTLVWTGGVQGNSVVANSGLEVQRGRATVTDYLQSTSHEEVFLAGDSAVVMSPSGRPYPPTAQLSWQMGETVGYNLAAVIKGGPLKKFEPVFSGTLASLGRKDAIGTVGSNQIRLKGMPASLMKEASNMRYLSHINGLYTLAY